MTDRVKLIVLALCSDVFAIFIRGLLHHNAYQIFIDNVVFMFRLFLFFTGIRERNGHVMQVSGQF